MSIYHNTSTMSKFELTTNNLSTVLNKIITNESYFGHESIKKISTDTPFNSLYIAWLCSAGILFILGVTANASIIVTLAKIERLRVPSNFLIGNLAVADLMMMGVMTAFVLCDLNKLKLPDSVATFLWPSLDVMIGSASIISLAAISFDRATAVARPLRYNERINFHRTFFAIRCIWCYSVLMFILGMLRCILKSKGYCLTFLYGAYIFSFIIPFVVIIVSYTLILIATVKNVKVSRRITEAVINAGRNLREDDTPVIRRTRHFRIQEIKIAARMMIILLPFVAGWGFYFGTHFYEIVTRFRRDHLYEWFIFVVPWVCSSINPFVYLISNSALRKGCKKISLNFLVKSKEHLISTLSSKRNSVLESGTINRKLSLFDNLTSIFRRSPSSLDVELKIIENSDDPQERVELHQDENNCLCCQSENNCQMMNPPTSDECYLASKVDDMCLVTLPLQQEVVNR